MYANMLKTVILYTNCITSLGLKPILVHILLKNIGNHIYNGTKEIFLGKLRVTTRIFNAKKLSDRGLLIGSGEYNNQVGQPRNFHQNSSTLIKMRG